MVSRLVLIIFALLISSVCFAMGETDKNNYSEATSLQYPSQESDALKLQDPALKEAIKISNAESVKVGGSVQNLLVNADATNSLWQENLKRVGEKYWEDAGVLQKLRDKNYWAIHYSSDDPIKTAQYGGAGTWVFIDKDNNSVLHVAVMA